MGKDAFTATSEEQLALSKWFGNRFKATLELFKRGDALPIVLRAGPAPQYEVTVFTGGHTVDAGPSFGTDQQRFEGSIEEYRSAMRDWHNLALQQHETRMRSPNVSKMELYWNQQNQWVEERLNERLDEDDDGSDYIQFDGGLSDISFDSDDYDDLVDESEVKSLEEDEND
jgi:hypothetical protein